MGLFKKILLTLWIVDAILWLMALVFKEGVGILLLIPIALLLTIALIILSAFYHMFNLARK